MVAAAVEGVFSVSLEGLQSLLNGHFLDLGRGEFRSMVIYSSQANRKSRPCSRPAVWNVHKCDFLSLDPSRQLFKVTLGADVLTPVDHKLSLGRCECSFCSDTAV